MLNLKIPQQTCTEFEWNVVEVPNFPFQKQNVNKVNLTKSLSHTHTIHSQFDAFNWVFIYQKTIWFVKSLSEPTGDVVDN